MNNLIVRDKFEEYLEYLGKIGRTEKTVREHRRFLYGAIEHSSLVHKQIRELKLTDVASLIESGRTHGEFGPQRSVVTFRRYLKFLKDNGVKTPFDWRDIQVPKVPFKQQPFFEFRELERILDSFNLDSPKIATRKIEWSLKVLCEVLFATGARISEALQLQRTNFEEIKLKQEIVIKGKGGDERSIFFSNRSIEWLEKYLAQRTDTCDAMFVNSFGVPLKMVTAKSHIGRFRQKFGEDGRKIKFHTFRRSLSNHLFERNVDIKSVQLILGHKSERTTLKHYVRINKVRAKEKYGEVMDT